MSVLGFVGVGSMGGMLVRGFTAEGAVSPENVIASNRSKEKLALLASSTGIRAAADNRQAVSEADVVFHCVKPLEAKNSLDQLRDLLTPEKLLISIAAGVTIKDLLSWSGARIVKVIPSLTAECRKGVSLVCFAENAVESDRTLVNDLFGRLGGVLEIEEKHFELYADLTSCAPAFISAVMREFAAAAVRREKIPFEVAEYLVRETLAGTSELLSAGRMGFGELIGRVATRGGITEEGVKVIGNMSPAVFDEVLNVTLAKHDLLKKTILQSAGDCNDTGHRN